MHTCRMTPCDGELKPYKKAKKYVPEATCMWYTLTRSIKVKYVYRRVPYSPEPGPAFINLRDGDEIRFGGGVKGETLGSGPLPLLCNVQLAMARVFDMRGAGGGVLQLNRDAEN